MNEVFFLVEETLEGGYTAKALSESIFTDADTLEELKVKIKEAVRCHFEEDDLPEIIRLQFIKEELLAIKKMPAQYFSGKLQNKVQTAIKDKNITDADLDSWVNE